MKVSICSSVFNQSEWLREMIQSILAQTFKDWELVLVDDGSTEDIKSIVDEFKDDRIRFHRFDTNRGIPFGINWAFREAKGEYIQPIAADEWLIPGKLEQQVKFLDENPEDAVCGLPQHGIEGVQPGERPSFEQYILKAHNRSKEQWVRTFVELDMVPIGSVSALCRRKVFEDIGYFREDLKPFVDHEWWTRFFRLDKTIKMTSHRWAMCKDSPVDSVRSKVTKEEATKELELVKALHPMSVPMGDKVTIAIPCKDMGRFVKATIDSCINQTHKNIEIIVVNDGSIDDSDKVISSINDQRIRHITFVENRGQQEALNHALQVSTGEFFIPLSADDTIEPNFCEECLRIFNLNPCCEFIASQTDFIHEDGSPYTEDHIFKRIQKASNRSQEEWKATFRLGNVYFGAGMIKTKALKYIGGFNKDSGVISDYEIYLKLVHRFDIYVIEKNLTHTRIHNDNQSNKCDPRWLRKKYYDIQNPFYPPKRRLIIATPFYNSQGFAPYIMSLQRTLKLMTMAGIDWDYWEISGDAYVDRAKNTIVNKFLEDPYNTDLFMIDSDMSWNAESFLAMLDMPEEIIVGSYPMKNAWAKWTSTPKVTKEDDGKITTMGRRLPDGGTLLQGSELAGGFMRIKREAFEKYREAFKDRTYQDVGADPTVPDRVYQEYFRCDIHDGMRWGEDRYFSRNLKSIGMDWWIYTNIDFGHYGMTGYHGNFHAYLQKPAEAKNDNPQTH